MTLWQNHLAEMMVDPISPPLQLRRTISSRILPAHLHVARKHHQDFPQPPYVMEPHRNILPNQSNTMHG